MVMFRSSSFLNLTVWKELQNSSHIQHLCGTSMRSIKLQLRQRETNTEEARTISAWSETKWRCGRPWHILFVRPQTNFKNANQVAWAPRVKFLELQVKNIRTCSYLHVAPLYHWATNRSVLTTNRTINKGLSSPPKMVGLSPDGRNCRKVDLILVRTNRSSHNVTDQDTTRNT